MKREVLLGVVLATAAALVLVQWPGGVPSATAQASEGESATFDRVILDNGDQVLEGQIIEEREDGILFLVRLGQLTAERFIKHSEILTITRDISRDGEGNAAASAKAKDARAAFMELPEEDVKIYHVKVDGDLGYDWEAEYFEDRESRSVSQTPLREIFEDVDATFGDITSYELPGGEVIERVDPAVQDKHIVLLEYDLRSTVSAGYMAIFMAEEIGPVFEEQFDKGRRVIFWVGEASNGGAFFPFVSPEIVFKPDGQIYFTSDLENFHTGDLMVDEKLISAYIGHGKGFAVNGGYSEFGPRIIECMSRSRYWLSYRLEGGKPNMLIREPTPAELRQGYQVLTDNGKGAYSDSQAGSLAPDLLVLDATHAHLFGISKTPSDSIPGIAANLGLGTYHVLEHTRGDQILEDWGDAINQAIEDLRDGFLELDMLFGRLARTEGNNAGQMVGNRRKVLGQITQQILKMERIFKKYEEVLDPSGQEQAFLRLLRNSVQQQGEFEQDLIRDLRNRTRR